MRKSIRKIKIRKARKSSYRRILSEILVLKLYSNPYRPNLSGIYRVIKEDKVISIITAYDDKTLIGAGIFHQEIFNCNYSIYINKNYRRQGIGAKITRSMSRYHLLKVDTNAKYRKKFFKCLLETK